MSDRSTAREALGGTARRSRTFGCVLQRLDRYAAWLSALLLLLFLISGFGMTKPVLVGRMTGGLITWRVAYDMHNLLHIPLIVGFAIHTFMGLRRALTRTTRRKKLAGAISAAVALVVLGFLLTLSQG
jgi:cytochrome b subunit of formate dehydrogenase